MSARRYATLYLALYGLSCVALSSQPALATAPESQSTSPRAAEMSLRILPPATQTTPAAPAQTGYDIVIAGGLQETNASDGQTAPSAEIRLVGNNRKSSRRDSSGSRALYLSDGYSLPAEEKGKKKSQADASNSEKGAEKKSDSKKASKSESQSSFDRMMRRLRLTRKSDSKPTEKSSKKASVSSAVAKKTSDPKQLKNTLANKMANTKASAKKAQPKSSELKLQSEQPIAAQAKMASTLKATSSKQALDKKSPAKEEQAKEPVADIGLAIADDIKSKGEKTSSSRFGISRALPTRAAQGMLSQFNSVRKRITTRSPKPEEVSKESASEGDIAELAALAATIDSLENETPAAPKAAQSTPVSKAAPQIKQALTKPVDKLATDIASRLKSAPLQENTPIQKRTSTQIASAKETAPRSFITDSQLSSVEATSAVQGPVPTTTPWPGRAKIVYQPAVVDRTPQGSPVLRPSIRLADQPQPVQPPAPSDIQFMSNAVDTVPEAAMQTPVPQEWSAPIVDGYDSGAYYSEGYYGGGHYVESYSNVGCGDGCCNSCNGNCYGGQCSSCQPRLGPMQKAYGRIRACLNGPCCSDPGLGPERVMHAISFVETSQPLNNFRVQFDSGIDYMAPDRSEYFWAQIGGKGPPAAESGLDYNDLRLYQELGGKKFSVGTEIPIRFVDPIDNLDTAGLGDVTITTKTVFLEGKKWQLTNLFKTYIPSGDPDAGLGTGHASIEPGFAYRYKWSDITYLHGDIKFWVPLGADPDHSGQVLSYGLAVSHVWYDSDSMAIMPTLEFVGYSFLDGNFTDPDGNIMPVDNDVVFNIHPGVRIAVDRGSDCGTQEFGIFGGVSTTANRMYEGFIRAELRWSW